MIDNSSTTTDVSPNGTAQGAPSHDAASRDAAARAVLADRVHALLRNHLDLDVAAVDTDLIDEGLLDSFALVELMVAVEDHIGVELELDDFDVDDFRTARTIAGLIARQHPGVVGGT